MNITKISCLSVFLAASLFSQSTNQPAAGGATAVGSTGDVQMKNSSGGLSAAPINCTGGNCAIGNALLVPTQITTASTVNPVAGFNINNASGAVSYTLPTITTATVGLQMCFRNAVTRTGAITVTAPASTFIDVGGANGSAAGNLVSSGALGDSACFVAISTTQYLAYIGTGSWTGS